jgi:hypothetical protein
MDNDRVAALRLLVECLIAQNKTAEAAETQKALDALLASGTPARN